jgi:hypothetical protein
MLAQDLQGAVQRQRLDRPPVPRYFWFAGLASIRASASRRKAALSAFLAHWGFVMACRQASSACSRAQREASADASGLRTTAQLALFSAKWLEGTQSNRPAHLQEEMHRPMSLTGCGDRG